MPPTEADLRHRRRFTSKGDAEGHIFSLLQRGPRLNPSESSNLEKIYSRQWMTSESVLDGYESLPFELLPPGTFDRVRFFKDAIRRSYGSQRIPEAEWSRWYQVEKELNGRLLMHGKTGWRGYGVFIFPHCDRVLIDTVITGNAAYVLQGDWRQMVELTKAQIRAEYQSESLRIFHSGEWVTRVEEALYREILNRE